MVSPKRKWRVRVTSARRCIRTSDSRATSCGKLFSWRRSNSRASPLRKRQSSSETVNSTLSWIEARALVERACRRADPQTGVPHLLAHTAHRVLHTAAQGVILSQEQKVDIGMREKRAAAEAAQCGQREAAADGWRDMLLPKLQRQLVDKLRAVSQRGLARAVSLRTPAADARTLAGTTRESRVRAQGWTCSYPPPGKILTPLLVTVPSRRALRCVCGWRRRRATEKSCRRRSSRCARHW